jgi:hypothetical protein
MLVLLAGVLLSGSAHADLAPSMEHEAIATAQASTPVEVKVKIVSNSAKAIFNPTLYFRVPAVGPSFNRIDLKPIAGVADLFSATIPGNLVSGDFDYYLEAYDEAGNGPARMGTDVAPLHVQVGRAARADVKPAGDVKADVKPNLNPVQDTRPAASSGKGLGYGLLIGGISGVVVGGLLIGGGLYGISSSTTSSSPSAGAFFGGGLALFSGLLLAPVGVIVTIVGVVLLAKSDSPAVAAESSAHPSVAQIIFDFAPPRFTTLSRPLASGPSLGFQF